MVTKVNATKPPPSKIKQFFGNVNKMKGIGDERTQRWKNVKEMQGTKFDKESALTEKEFQSMLAEHEVKSGK